LLVHCKLPDVGTLVALAAGKTSCGNVVVQSISDVALDALFEGFESVVVEVMVAVFVTEPGPAAETLYEVTIVTLCPPLSDPMLQGSAVQNPPTLVNVRRDGVGSARTIPFATTLPRFLTMIV